MMIILLLFFQKQNLASAIYLFGLGTRPFGNRPGESTEVWSKLAICSDGSPDIPIIIRFFPVKIEETGNSACFNILIMSVFHFISNLGTLYLNLSLRFQFFLYVLF
jgi:hypothetical protein